MLESDGVGRGTYYFLPGHLPSTTFESLDLELAHKESELAHKEKLTQIAEQVAMQKRADPKEVRDIIVTLCTMCELSNQELAHLLNRNEKSLRTHYLNPLCEEGLLCRKYSAKNHPRQKYRIGKTQLKKSFLRG
jgi:ATP-dependent DNA helicase RecG